MALSNTAVPKYYGMFRDAVLRGEIPVCKEISMEMNRIDQLIDNKGVYYDDAAVEGFVQFCEKVRRIFVKAERNKTIDITVEEGQHYLKRCVSVCSPTEISTILDKT